MRCRLQINLAIVAVSFLIASLLSHCNCGDEANGDDGNSSVEVVRINNGYATKSADGNLSLKRCDKNYADCNGDIYDGCESNLSSDRNNCGRCGKVCIAPNDYTTVDCKNSECVVDFCAEGYIDLDQKYENGCEYRCKKQSDKETAYNFTDDDCDGYIDNVCKYAVDSRTYIVAPDMSGKVADIVSSSNNDYIVVTYIELKPDNREGLSIGALNREYENLFSVNIKDIEEGCSAGYLNNFLKDDSIFVFWSENCPGESKILYEVLNNKGIVIQSETVLYSGYEDIYNIIVTEANDMLYLSFETTENTKRVIILLEVDISKGMVLTKRLVSTSGVDCYGHNIYISNDQAYVSYWEVKNGVLELVIMANGLAGNDKRRYSIYQTTRNALGTAISYGNGYFVLMWTETQSTLGALYLAIINSDMQVVVQKSVDISYDEFGLPVVIYDNIFGSVFAAMKNNRGYILFSDMDVEGKKISELIVSPVTFVNKPFMSKRGDEFLVFYADINSKMRYYLNMKRVYCIKN